MLVAVLVTVFSASFTTRSVVKAVFFLAMLQPFGMFSSIMWRDSVGQLFFITGAILVVQYRGKFIGIGKLLVGVALMMLQRNIYILVAITSAAVSVASLYQKRSMAFYSGLIAILVTLAFTIPYLFNNVFAFYDLKNSQLTYASESLSIPKKILTAMVGPFPWTQIFDPLVVGREYLFADTLQSTFSLTAWYLVLSGLLKRRLFWYGTPYSTVLAVALLTTLMGALTYGHTSYVTLPTVLLLPIIPDLKVRRFIWLWATLTFVVIILGILWELYKSI